MADFSVGEYFLSMGYRYYICPYRIILLGFLSNELQSLSICHLVDPVYLNRMVLSYNIF